MTFEGMTMAKLNHMIPMLNVRDVHASLQFYQDVLEFALDSPQEALEE